MVGKGHQDSSTWVKARETSSGPLKHRRNFLTGPGDDPSPQNMENRMPKGALPARASDMAQVPLLSRHRQAPILRPEGVDLPPGEEALPQGGLAAAGKG